MKQVAEEGDDLFAVIFSELKSLGVKVPKVKKFKCNIPKQEKTFLTTNSRIFGVSLSDQELVPEANFLLPKFIATSTAYLRRYAEKEIGLFRKAGSVVRQRDLRMKLEKGGNIFESEPNDVAALLKQWLRELPESLIPPYLHDLFLRCQSLDIEENRTSALLLCCLLLPPTHLQTLKHLVCFLADIAARSEKNKMGTHNLAVVMAPNIFVLGTDCIDKSSNNLVQLHASLVELLIKNADKIGEVPSPVSSRIFVEQDTMKYGTELNNSSDMLDFSPCKSKKKRKSGTVQDLFSGIRKLVGQNLNSPTPSSNRLTPDKPQTDQSDSRCASKRKADPELHSLSAVKKQATASNAVLNASVNVTPNSKIAQNVISTNERTGRGHIRRKSFGLLKRKAGKRQKSSKTKEQEEQKISIVATNIFEPSPQETKPNNKCEGSSPLLSSSDIENIMKRSLNVQKSKSDCYLTVSNKEFKDISTPFISKGSLPNTPLRSSHYNLRSDKIVKRLSNSQFAQLDDDATLKQKSSSRKRKSMLQECEAKDIDVSISDYNQLMVRRSEKEACLSECLFINCSLNLSTENHILGQKLEAKNISYDNTELHSPIKMNSGKSNMDNVKDMNSLQSNNQDSQIDGTEALKNGISKACSASTNSVIKQCADECLVKTNEKSESKICHKQSINRQAFIIKSCFDGKKSVTQVRSLDSTHVKFTPVTTATSHTLKEKSDTIGDNLSRDKSVNGGNVKTPRKKGSRSNVRNSSIVRGRPNTVKTGLPSDVCSRFNNETISISGRHISSFENDISFDIRVGKREENQTEEAFEPDMSLNLHLENINLSSPTDLDKNDGAVVMKTNLDLVSNVLGDSISGEQKMDLSSQVSFQINECNVRNTQKSCVRICSNSDTKIRKAKENINKVKRTSSFPEPYMRNKFVKSRHTELNNTTSKELFDTKFNEDCKENVQSNILTPVNSFNNNNMKTPANEIHNMSEETWLSGKKFLDADASLQDDVFNKRESIAMILKNNPGHVQAKVHLYDYKAKSLDTSTSSVQRNSTPLSIFNLNSEEKQKMYNDVVEGRTARTRSAQRICSLQNNQETPNSRHSHSAFKANNSKTKVIKSYKSPIPPPPKFTVTDLNSSSPKLSYPLKNVTNLNNSTDDLSFVISPGKRSSHNTPLKDKNVLEDLFEITAQSNWNLTKPKRNSFSGHTPHKMSKVCRSESSPAFTKRHNRSSRHQDSFNRSPPLITIHDDNVSTPHQTQSPVLKSGSSLSIEKLRSDQLMDEWLCEM